MLAEYAEMKQHVTFELVANEEPEAAGRIEPFHSSGHRRQVGLGRIVIDSAMGEPPLGQTTTSLPWPS